MIIKVAAMLTFLFINTIAATSQTTSSMKSANQKSSLAKNKEMILKLFQEVVNQRNLSYFDKIYVPNAIDHNAWEGQESGTEGIKKAVKEFLEIFSSLKVTVEDIIAEGNKVTTRETWEGTKKSTGKSGSGTVIHIFWIKNGNVTEEWSQGWDWVDKF